MLRSLTKISLAALTAALFSLSASQKAEAAYPQKHVNVYTPAKKYVNVYQQPAKKYVNVYTPPKTYVNVYKPAPKTYINVYKPVPKTYINVYKPPVKYINVYTPPTQYINVYKPSCPCNHVNVVQTTCHQPVVITQPVCNCPPPCDCPPPVVEATCPEQQVVEQTVEAPQVCLDAPPVSE